MDMATVLPADCMSLVLSLTSPRDACRVAVVSRGWRSVADSDAVWQRFLPRGYDQIISKSSSPSLLSLPNKALYFTLCHQCILIHNGTMSFQLEKENGKRCYMLGARSLSIKWADTPDYWTWISLPDSRFSEVAKLKKVYGLVVKGKTELKTLSSQTNYAAYLVFKIVRDRYGFRHAPVELRIAINEGSTSASSKQVVYSRSVVLDPPPSAPQQQQATERGDGWMEVEMGEFFNDCGDHDHDHIDNKTVEFYLRQVHDHQSKRGLIVQGIELRPKHNYRSRSSAEISRFDSFLLGRTLKCLVCKFAKSISTLLL